MQNKSIPSKYLTLSALVDFSLGESLLGGGLFREGLLREDLLASLLARLLAGPSPLPEWVS